MDPVTTEVDEIELDLTKIAEDRYVIQSRYRCAGYDAFQQFPREPVAFAIPPELPLPAADPLAYGKLLGDAVFADPAIRDAMQRAIGPTRDKALRVRLFCDDDNIQQLFWETICFNGQPLFSGQVCLSRYLSPDQQSPRPPLRPSLRALVFIASPLGIDTTSAVDDPSHKPLDPPSKRPKLAPIDVEKEKALALQNLVGVAGGVAIVPEFLVSPGANFAQLMSRLDQGFDLLYMICHGSLGLGYPCLYLEDETTGAVKTVKGADLAAALAVLPKPPRLIVLASCQSAATGDPVVASNKLVALGPLLARAGVPAVIAMQGFVTMRTAGIFSSRLFAELCSDGQVDRAVAVARASACAQQRPDYWMPVLFSSSQSGTLFQPYRPGFEEQQDSSKPAWDGIIQRTRPEGGCVPVLGPDCLEPVWGSTQEIAAWLADKYNFPLEEHLSENLPAVAQFLKWQEDDDFLFDVALIEYLKDKWKTTSGTGTVWERLAAAGKARRAAGALPPGTEDIHALMAALPYPLYITASPDRLLEDALTEVGRTPRSDYPRWKDSLRLNPLDKVEAGYKPSTLQPFVYHLFGDSAVPDSIVSTEDDYNDYMLGINTPGAVSFAPDCVSSALAASALLFAGFHFKDRGFQIVIRNTLKGNSGKKKVWVGAQIPPEKDRYRRVQAARDYMEKNAQLKVYWGTTQDFVNDFGSHARIALPQYFLPKATGTATA